MQTPFVRIKLPFSNCDMLLYSSDVPNDYEHHPLISHSHFSAYVLTFDCYGFEQV